MQLDLFIFLMQQGSVWRAIEVSVASNVQFLVTDKQTTAKTQLTEKCGCSPLFRKSPGRVCKFKTKHQNIYENAVLPSVLLPLGVCTDWNPSQTTPVCDVQFLSFLIKKQKQQQQQTTTNKKHCSSSISYI